MRVIGLVSDCRGERAHYHLETRGQRDLTIAVTTEVGDYAD